MWPSHADAQQNAGEAFVRTERLARLAAAEQVVRPMALPRTATWGNCPGLSRHTARHLIDGSADGVYQLAKPMSRQNQPQQPEPKDQTFGTEQPFGLIEVDGAPAHGRPTVNT
jgi:hypothetical protein